MVWITLLALADQHGEVQASIPGLADVARVTIKECEDALVIFLSPDPYSRNKTLEGRRIVEIPGGWSIVNYDLYRGFLSLDHRRALARERQARHRAKKRNAVTRDITRSNTKSRQAEAEANTEKATTTTKATTSAPSESGDNNGQRLSWPQEGAAIWTEKVSPIEPPRFGKALKPVVLQYGWPDTRAALLTYIELNQGKARKAEWFAGDAVKWVRLSKMPVVDPVTRELTEKGRMV